MFRSAGGGNRRPSWIIRSRLRARIYTCILCMLALGVACCAPPVKKRDWTNYTGPGAEYFHALEIHALDFADPIEPFNRTVTAMNDGLVLGFLEPVGRGYAKVVPAPVRNAVTRFGKNLLFPRRALASLLQDKREQARNETRRFLINSTLGVLGLFDVAERKFGIQAGDEDFGLVFAHAGWKNSRYLSLPFIGPSTGRDAVGLIPDWLTDPAFYYYYPFRPFLSFNESADSYHVYGKFIRTTHDPYALTRVFWLLDRDRDIANFEYEPDTGPAVRTLQGQFMAANVEASSLRLKTRRVHLPATGRKLSFSFRIQDRPAAPIVFILPGLGAHRESSQAQAIADLVWREGYSVAIISSAFNWEFMRQASTVSVPGHTPVDANDVYVALDAVAKDLDRRFPGHIGPRRLLGYSMGAFHAFYIAAQEQRPDNELIKFDRYVTLDAPVRLLHGAREIDAFYNSPLAFPPDERAERIRHMLGKGIALGRGKLEPDQPLPFTELEARFLIGLSFRLTLQSIIFESQQRHDMGVLLTKRTPFRRSAAYEEIFDYSLMEYAFGFVLPYYMGDQPSEADAERLLALNDLRSIGDALRKSGKIRHVANYDDFLVTVEDIEWLIDTLGPQNATFLPSGGHLGNLYKPEVRHRILQALNTEVE